MRLISTFVVPIAMALALPAFATENPNASAALESADRLLAKGALEDAALAYSAFARDFPRDPGAARAFADAVIMNARLGLLDAGGAESDLRHFENTFVPVNLDIWSEMAFALIDGFGNRDMRNAAIALLHRTIAVTDQLAVVAHKKKTTDLQTLREIEVRARGRLARFYAEMGDHQGVGIEHARIQKIVPELGVWPGKKLARNSAKDTETIEFIAETLFYEAEQKRFAAERMHLPSYLGNGDRDSVLHFVSGAGMRWYENREFAVQDALRSYAFVFGVELPKPIPPKPPPPPPPPGTIGLLGGDPVAPMGSANIDPTSPDYEGPPFPSPRWAIAAAERIGKLWSSFVRESRMMPIPKEWRPVGLIPGTDLSYADLKCEYDCFGESPDEVQKQHAKQAYKLCLDLSVKHRIVNKHTRACINWLSKNYGAEYHEIDDFAPPGEFVALRIVPRPAPLPVFQHK